MQREGEGKCMCMYIRFQMFQMALLLFKEKGEHLCKIILKSMHICRSYGPEKLIYVTLKCDLDLQPT